MVCWQNRIKREAREHERFRRICNALAQGLHRLDMRMRLGLLQDPAAIERQIEREAKAAEARRQHDQAPTVKTEEAAKADQSRTAEEKARIEKEIRERYKPRVRPLSEAKAIEMGANFASEVFIYSIAIGLLVFDSWRSNRKEKSRREGVADRLEALEEIHRRMDEDKRDSDEKIGALEAEVLRLRAQLKVAGDSEKPQIKRSEPPDGADEHEKSVPSTKEKVTASVA